MRTRVKIFTSYVLKNMEEYINDFLEENNDIKVNDIKFKEGYNKETGESFITVLIIYTTD